MAATTRSECAPESLLPARLPATQPASWPADHTSPWHSLTTPALPCDQAPRTTPLHPQRTLAQLADTSTKPRPRPPSQRRGDHVPRTPEADPRRGAQGNNRGARPQDVLVIISKQQRQRSSRLGGGRQQHQQRRGDHGAGERVQEARGAWAGRGVEPQ